MARITLYNEVRHVLLVHDNGYKEVIPKGYGKLVLSPTQGIMHKGITGHADMIADRPSQIKAIYDNSAGGSQLVPDTMTEIFDLIYPYFCADSVVRDGVSNSALTVDYAHHEMHEGSAFFATYSGLADNTNAIEVLITTPPSTTSTKQAHMEIGTVGALAATFSMWIDSTKTDNESNRISPINRNQNSSNTSALTICHTPGGSQAGTANIIEYYGSANAGGVGSTGGGRGQRHEFILKYDTKYLLRLASRANANALMITLDWYEHSPKSTAWE